MGVGLGLPAPGDDPAQRPGLGDCSARQQNGECRVRGATHGFQGNPVADSGHLHEGLPDTPDVRHHVRARALSLRGASAILPLSLAGLFLAMSVMFIVGGSLEVALWVYAGIGLVAVARSCQNGDGLFIATVP